MGLLVTRALSPGAAGSLPGWWLCVESGPWPQHMGIYAVISVNGHTLLPEAASP